MTNKKIELLSPAGSMANLKAAVSRGADAVYLGMRGFSARAFATNFTEEYLRQAVSICRSNNTKLYLTMNTLVKNSELKNFFSQLSFAYSAGIDSVIIQETSFLDIIKENYPGLNVHISTQASVMNSDQASLFKGADRITLARELSKDEIQNIRNSYSKELEVFYHGALCVCMSGSCLFSSVIGGRSGNRGSCAQPCRKKYDGKYFLSTKDLCLIDEIPTLAKLKIDSLKIEGRMRSPYYVATVTDIYRKAIDSHYSGSFSISDEDRKKLYDAFSREFTKGWFSESKEIFNTSAGSGESIKPKVLEHYEVNSEFIPVDRKLVNIDLPKIEKAFPEKKLLVKVYSSADAIAANSQGADIIYLDIFNPEFKSIKENVSCKVFAVTPRIMLDSDKEKIIGLIKKQKPDGILAGNLGVLAWNLNLPLHLDYNINTFNDIDINYLSKKSILPIISLELSHKELFNLKDKRFAVFVHGKISIMTLRHKLKEGIITDEKGGRFKSELIHNGSLITNEKELGLLSKSTPLIKAGISNFFIDTEINVSEVVKFYRNILDGKPQNSNISKKDYVLGWSFKGVR